MTNTTNTTEAREVTMKELAQAFEGKHVNVSSTDHYGIAIEMHKGTIEFENDLKPELWLVSRDSENNVTSSICIGEEAIESIEVCGDIYTINFTLDMESVDISEYKTIEQLRKEQNEKQKA